MRNMFARALIEVAKAGRDVHLLTGDLGFGVLKPCRERLPEQLTNVGITEQNMTGIAAGMALSGKKVLTYSIGDFPTLRCLEQTRNDCVYYDANTKIVCVGDGFVYGSLSMSRHATEDLAIMRALPPMIVMASGDLTEAVTCTHATYEHSGICYLRLGGGGEQKIHGSIVDFQIGKTLRIRDGEEVATFSIGGIFDEALGAVELLNKKGICPALYTFLTVKPIDKELVTHCSHECDLTVTVKEHNIISGPGSAVLEVLSELPSRVRQTKIGLNDTYSCIVGSQKYLRNRCGVSAEKTAERIEMPQYNSIETVICPIDRRGIPQNDWSR